MATEERRARTERRREPGAPPARRRLPAFYALRPGGWRDLVTLLHPPYTLWHLSYVALGAAAAGERLQGSRLAFALLAFFLAVGLGAHALDELNGRPLGTQLSERALQTIAILGVGGGVAIGIAGLFVVSVTLLPLVLAGGFIVVAYNLELFGGRFHSDFWFAAAWGAFPALVGWWANALGLHSADEAIAAAAVVLACFMLSVAQRTLSTPVRELRRRTESVAGEQRLRDGRVKPLSAAGIGAPLEGALKALSAALPLLALGAVILRL